MLDKILDEVDGLKDVALEKFESALTPGGSLWSRKSEKRMKRPSLKNMRHYGQFRARSKVLPSEPIEGQLPESHPIPEVDPSSSIVMLWKVKIKDLKANIPKNTESLGYMSTALIRPVVGYMNANKTLIQLSLSAQMDIENFNGAWDVYAAGLADVLSEEMGRALTTVVKEELASPLVNAKRLKQIGLWSVGEISQMILQLLEHARGDRGWSNYQGDSVITI